MAACGGYDSSNPGQVPTSKVPKRVLIANAFNGSTQIVNATTDQLSGFGIGTTGRPAIMQTVLSQHLTSVYEDLNHNIQLLDDTQEQVLASISMGSLVDDMAVQSDGKFIYTARASLARVDKIDVVARAFATPVNAPARRLALSPDNSKLIVFADPSTGAADAITILKTSDMTKLLDQTAPINFYRAITGFFSADGSKAYILGCGKECGSTDPALTLNGGMITILDMTTPTPTKVGSVQVEGATTGLLNGTTLYVTGNRMDPNPGGAGLPPVLVPRLNVVNVSNATTPTATQISATVQDGLHTMMALGANNKLFIGGRNCTGSCLTIFDTANNSTTAGALGSGPNNTPVPFGNVTSIQPISGRNVVYVIEGGDLKIYDTTTNTLQATQIITTGALSVMNQIDP
jgi:hypothetical protein